MKLQQTGKSELLKIAFFDDPPQPIPPDPTPPNEEGRKTPEGVKKERLRALAGLNNDITEFTGAIESVEYSLTLETPADDALNSEPLRKIITNLRGILAALEKEVNDYAAMLRTT